MIKVLKSLLTKSLQRDIEGLSNRVYKLERRLSCIEKADKRRVYRDELQPGQIIWTEDSYGGALYGPYRVDKVLPGDTVRASFPDEPDNRFDIGSELIWTAK